jgi:hypothetical protein
MTIGLPMTLRTLSPPTKKRGDYDRAAGQGGRVAVLDSAWRHIHVDKQAMNFTPEQKVQAWRVIYEAKIVCLLKALGCELTQENLALVAELLQGFMEEMP